MTNKFKFIFHGSNSHQKHNLSLIGESEFDINANPHIYFTRSNNNDSEDLARYLASPKHPKMIYLLNPSYEFDVFKFIERKFTITTKKGSYLFNINFLKDTSSTIREIIKENPHQLQYHLNTEDEENIMQKVEQLYIGEKVKFSDDELNLLKPITKELELDILSFAHKFSGFLFSSNNLIRIKLSNFYSFLQKTLPRTFSIITKNKEYQCNIIGIHSSKIIDELLSKDPTLQLYNYDFPDEFGEFQQICDFFNFNFVKINIDNMNTMKTIAEDLQIDIVLNDIEDFIENYEKRVQTIDEQQSIIDSIDELFELLFNIKQITVESVKQKIIESDWIQTEENIQELVAFILQAIQTDFLLHPYLADLIKLLDKESNEFEQLKIFVPFIVKKLMQLFGQDKLICSFIFLLQQRGIIEKDEIMDILGKLALNKKTSEKYIFNSGFVRSQNDLKNKCESYLIFLPELFEIFNSNLDTLLRSFDSKFHNFIKLYLPNKIEDFKKMRESGEPDDQITKALRNDDVDTLQSIVSKNHIDLINTLVPFNIFEEFVPNGKTNFIDYSAAYGSLKCFKYLLLNHATVTQNSFDLAVFGRNIEIVKIIDQKLAEPKENNNLSLKSVKKRSKESSINEKQPTDTIISTVKKHQNDLFDWIFEQKCENAIQDNNLIKRIILTASKNGDSHSIASIIDKGFDFCSFDKDICADIICNAASNGFYRFMKFLSMVMSKALNQNDHLLNFKGEQIFNSNASVSFGNLSIFKFFYERAKSMNLERAIIISIDQDIIKIIKYIFENYLDNLITNNKIDLTILVSNSIKLKTDDIFDYLFNQFKKMGSTTNISFSKIRLLSEACKYKKIEIGKKITEYILEKKESDNSKPNPDFSLPFYNAALSGSTELCQYFIDKKVFIDFEHISMIDFQDQNLCCIKKEILDIFTKFMPPESNEIFKAFYLTSAIRAKNKSLIEYILDQNELCNDDALFEAVKTLDIDIVNTILNKNSEPSFINQISNNGTALNLAVSLNNKEIVKRLLSIPGIDPSLYEVDNNTPLITAIIKPNIEITNLLLDFYGPNLKSQSWQLNEAIKKILSNYYSRRKPKSEFLPVLNRLLEIDIIDLNSHEYSLLSYACETNEIDIVKMLIKNDKVNVNFYTQQSGNTPLLIAINNQNIEIAKLLIECERTDINLRNYNKETALLNAVKNKLVEVVDLIINNPKFDPIKSCLNYAFYLSNDEISKQLSTLKDLDVNYRIIRDREESRSKVLGLHFKYRDKSDFFTTSLIYAANNRLFDKVELIVNHPSFDPNKSLVKEAIFITCKKKYYQIFNQLIKIINDDVNITNKNNQSLLQIAVNNGSDNIVRDIINSEKFDYDKSSFLKAFISSFKCSNPSFNIMTEMFDFDQAHKQLIDFKDKNSKLSSCFFLLNLDSSQTSEFVDFFLKHGADPNEPNNQGTYPLEYAIRSESIDMVTTLIDSGKIDFNKKLKKKSKASLEKDLPYSCSYLHNAVNDKEILSLFLDKKLMDVNITDSNGETPLMKACREKNQRSIDLLFTVDELDYKHRNNKGKDALDICMQLFHKKCNDPHETKEQYHKCLLQTFKEKESHFGLGFNFKKLQNRDDSHDNKANKDENEIEKIKKTPDIEENRSTNSNDETQNEKDSSKTVPNKAEQQTDEKSSLASQNTNKSDDENPSLTASTSDKSTDKKFSFSFKKSNQSDDENPSLTTNTSGKSTDKKFSFSFKKHNQSDDENPSSTASKSTDKKFSFSFKKSNQSDDKNPSLTTNTSGKSTDKKFSFLLQKSNQSDNENPLLTTSKSVQSSENTPKFNTHKHDQSVDTNPSFSSHKPEKSVINNTSNSHSINLQENNSDSSSSESTQKVKHGSKTHIEDEIAAAICDTLNLDGLMHDQAVKITEKLVSISEKHGKDFINNFSSKETPKEREPIQTKEEEIKGDRVEERKIKSSTNSLNEKQRNRLDFDDDYVDEYLFDDQNENNFYEPSSYQNQMLNQQWNQMMQMGNMRDMQFNMIMQQQGQMMMMNIKRKKSIKSSVKQKSKKRKGHK